ncbi:MAG: hypothetical protein IT318_02065 [Anaerolineales bacterium]|nr:hypothetical protein [Anaerolineales bacterium]
MPTLTADEREGLVLDLLASPRCLLPCWWDIIPGSTRWAAVLAWYGYAGIRTGADAQPDGRVFHGAGGLDIPARSIHTRVGIWEKSGIVDVIQVHSEGGTDVEVWQVAWSQYAPAAIIGQYGVPSRVWLESTSSSPVPETNHVGYYLWLFYDPAGFVVGYSGAAEWGEQYTFCPRFEGGEDIASLDLLAHAADNLQSLETELNLTTLGLQHARSLEEVTGLSVEAFAALFEREERPGCFHAPRDVWP